MKNLTLFINKFTVEISGILKSEMVINRNKLKGCIGMIIREREADFVMIEQKNHAQFAGDVMAQWKTSLFQGEQLRESVDYAIRMHDYGWENLDKSPFWNDKKQAPYSLFDFPKAPKIIFYTYGIDEVEKVDAYAALLCSRHYIQFFFKDTSKESKAFVKQEEERKKRIISALDEFDEKLFDFHYALLALGDTLSVFACVNEPGATKETIHPFFKKGLSLSSELGLEETTLMPSWSDEHTIVLDVFPFEKTINSKVIQKVVSKAAIQEKGLLDSYKETEYEEVTISVKSKES